MVAQQSRLVLCKGLQLAVETPRFEPLKHIVGSHLRGVHHVGGIKAIVAQLVRHDFVGREITHRVVSLLQHIGSQKQSGFGQRRTVQAIFQIAVGAHRQHDTQPRAAHTERPQKRHIIPDNLFGRSVCRPECRCRHFVAVGGHQSRLVRSVKPRCAPRHTQQVGLIQKITRRRKLSLNHFGANPFVGSRKSSVVKPAVPQAVLSGKEHLVGGQLAVEQTP